MPSALEARSQEAKEIVAGFIRDTFLFGLESRQLGDEDSLMDAGIVDSTGILELSAFLESRFAIKIEDAEFVPENLDTLSNICAFVARKANGNLQGLS